MAGCPEGVGVKTTHDVVYAVGNVSSSVFSEEYYEKDLLLDV